MSTWQSPKYYAALVLDLDARVQALAPKWRTTREATDTLAHVDRLLLELRQINQDLFADRAKVLQEHTKLQAPAGRWHRLFRTQHTLEALATEREKTLDHYGTLKTHIDQTLKRLEDLRKSLRHYLNAQKKPPKKPRPAPAPPESFAPPANGRSEEVAAWWDFAKTAVVTDDKDSVQLCTYCAGRLEPTDETCPSCSRPVSSTLHL